MDQEAIGAAMAFIRDCLGETNTPERFRSWDLAFKQQQGLDGERWHHVFTLKQNGRIKAQLTCVVHLGGDDWTKNTCFIKPLTGARTLWEYRYHKEGQSWMLRSVITKNQLDFFYRQIKLAIRVVCLGNDMMVGTSVTERLLNQGCTPDGAGLKQWLARNYRGDFSLSREGQKWYINICQGDLSYPPLLIRNEQLSQMLTLGELEAEFASDHSEAA